MTSPFGSDRLLSSGDEAGTAPGDRRFRPDVEGLRAVAILLVVLFHCGIHVDQGGFVGVDVFFVISGFVITGLLLRERESSERTGFLPFYARRARRLLPAAILVIVTVIVATALIDGHRDAVLAASDGRWSALFVANVHFTSVAPDVFSTRPVPLGQLWTLAVEEQFYLVYPAFFVLCAAPFLPWTRRGRLAVGLCAVIIISFAISAATSQPGVVGLSEYPFTRGWEFAVGGLVAVGTALWKAVPSWCAVAMSWAGIIVVVTTATTYSFRIAYPGYAASLPVLGTALVIVGGTAASRWGLESLLGRAPFRWLGRFSYSWYLWHWPILVIAAEYFHTSVEASIPRNLVLVGVALVIAAGTYFFVENPVRHSRWLADRPHAALPGAALLIASCVALTYAF
jgi:peptidoglycan/LPS O-acetylase OafA/YrhL